MTVLLISTEFPPIVGGIGTFALNLARGLMNSGAVVRVVTTSKIGGMRCDGDIVVSRIPAMLNRKVVKIFPLLYRTLFLCICGRPENIIAMTWTHEGIVANLLSRLLGIPYVIIVHGSEILQTRTQVRRRVMMGILNGAKFIVANSEYTRRVVLELGFRPDRVTVVNPPIDVSCWSRDLDTTAVDRKFALLGKQVIFTASRLVPRKGHAQVFHVMAEFRSKYPELVYVLTGEGTYRQYLQNLAERLGVADRIRMIGFVSPDELSQLFCRAEVYISPTQDDSGDVEGFGIALIEAAARGVPVIAGKSGGVPEAVLDGETGFLVDSAQIDELMRTLGTLLDDTQLRRDMGNNGRERVIREFGLERQTSRLREVLQMSIEHGNEQGI